MVLHLSLPLGPRLFILVNIYIIYQKYLATYSPNPHGPNFAIQHHHSSKLRSAILFEDLLGII